MLLEKKLKKDLKTLLTEYSVYLDNFNLVFSNSLNSNVGLIEKIGTYLVNRKGKQVRPFLLILSALSCGEVNENVYNSATAIELLHTATLIHDDVVDDSDFRRGFPSIKSKWKNKIAVLFGDFILSRSLIMATETQNIKMMNLISGTSKKMSQGELFQIEKIKKFNMSEEEYFFLINAKTASLISASCEIGGLMVNASDENLQKLRNFGELLGQAFQIKDDLLDYNGNLKILGKPVSVDLKEKKITLPLLYTFEEISKSEEKKIKKLIKKGLNNKDAKKIISTVHESGGYERAKMKAKELSDNAIEEIKDLPVEKHRKSLEDVARFVVVREN